MTQLTGLEVANASLYDGSTALAEAVMMGQRIAKKVRFLIAKSVHPEYRAVVSTYARNVGIELQTIDYAEDGRVDMEKLERALNGSVAAVVVQSPNFFGTVEKTHEVSELAHHHGALSIVAVCEAVSLGVLKPPGSDASDARTADIVVGEAQSLGVPISFGGPHVGFLVTRDRYMRQMPGRLVGMAKDYSGRQGFVLTLSTREQHIRREKATSNICTNQSLCALMATVYLSTLGPQGLREIAEQNVLKTDYTVRQVQQRTPHRVLFSAPRFNEFVLELKDDYARRTQRLLSRKVVPGIHVSSYYPELSNALLVCVTEVSRKQDIDRLVEGLA